MPLCAKSAEGVKQRGVDSETLQLAFLTNSNTMLECALNPSPGPGWNNDNPLAVSVQLTSSSGNTATTLVTFAGGAAPVVQAQIQVGTGAFPATTNGTGIWVVAQLVRNVINLTPIQSSPLVLSSFTLTSGGITQPFTTSGATCGLTSGSTMFECKLTPSPGPNWMADGPLVVRVELTATDGAKATTLLNFRIN